MLLLLGGEVSRDAASACLLIALIEFRLRVGFKIFRRKLQMLKYFVPFISLFIFSGSVFSLEPAEVFARVKQSIVVVYAADSVGVVLSQGSGVVIDRHSIVTNCHVIEDAPDVYIENHIGRVKSERLVGDIEKDVCFVKNTLSEFVPIKLGNTQNLEVGSVVYAIGSPKGLNLSLSNGIVSQLRGSVPPMIQTTAPISPGSSGGGLFDSNGLLVGITTFNIVDGQSLNFALPVEWVKSVKSNNTALAESTPYSRRVKFFDAVKEKNYQAAVMVAEGWVRAHPEDAEGYYRLGLAYSMLKQYQKSIEAYGIGLKLAPHYGPLWLQVGNAYFLQGQHSGALAAYQEATRYNPGDANVWFRQGYALLVLKRYEEAIFTLKKSIQINSNVAEVWNSLGQAYDLYALTPGGRATYDEKHHGAQTMKALDAYRTAHNLEADNAKYIIDFGIASAISGKCDDARSLLEKAMLLDPIKGIEFSAWMAQKNNYCNN